MGPLQSVRTCIRKSLDFRGYASRSEFWWWIVITEAVFPFTLMLGATMLGQSERALLYIIIGYRFVMVIPFAAVTARRLQSVGWTGWYQLVFWPIWPLGAVTGYMLSDALPRWANLSFTLFIFLWLGLLVFVIVQLFRKARFRDDEEGAAEETAPIHKKNGKFVPELYVPSIPLAKTEFVG